MRATNVVSFRNGKNEAPLREGGEAMSQSDSEISGAAFDTKGVGASARPIKPATVDASKPTVSHVLGELTWVLSQSPAHKHFAIGDLEWLVMPAILLEQFRVFHGDKHPLGFALWAYLSEEAETRMTTAVASGGGARLRPGDWKSGDRLWLIELVAPFATPDNKLTEAMIADLVRNVFGDKKFKFHSTDLTTGKREVQEIGKGAGA